MALGAGTRLGPYEILVPLGAGGMGEVYRARDTKLGRDVAIKVLPDEFARDPERLARFEREARALAALNHPGIAAIYGLDQEADTRFLALELVVGETLAQRVARGPLPAEQALELCRQVAEALEAAHEKGLIHRDLKPANVMVTPDDRVKLLDFGLAKAVGAENTGSDPADSPTVSELATSHGVILGTAAYMSPEQARGRPLDKRTDVWSFGCVLYELLTGRRAFAGETVSDTITAVLSREPDWNLLPARAPGLVRSLLRRCLRKDKGKRLRDIADAQIEIEEALATRAESAVATVALAATPERRRRGLWPVAFGLVATMLIGAAGGWLLARRRAGSTAPVTIMPFTSDGGYKRRPAVSPDGEMVAYSWGGPTGDPGPFGWGSPNRADLDVYVKGVGLGTKPLRLTDHPAPDRDPAWSPDGRQIAFVRVLEDGPAIYSVPWPSGQERRLIQLTGPSTWLFSGAAVTTLSWSPDGEWLAFAERPKESEPARIFRLTLATMEKQPLTSPLAGTPGDYYPAVSPDGREVAFVRASTGRWGNMDVWLQPLPGGEPRRLTSGAYDACGSIAWTTSGDGILFTAGWYRSRILRVSRSGGEPQPVLGVGGDAAHASVRGTRMVYQQITRSPLDIWRVPGRKGALADQAPEKLIGSSGNDNNPAYSPDGLKIAFSSSRSGIESIWVCDADGTNPVQLTDFDSVSGAPRWSPDGRRIVFDSLEAGDANIYVIDAEGGVPQRLTPEPSEDDTGTWSPDGSWIYFHSDRSGESQIWKLPSGGGPAVQVTHGGAGIYPEVSRDGGFVYYPKPDSLSSLWRVPVDGGQEMEAVRAPTATGPWALGRNGVYFCDSGSQELTIYHLDFESGQATELYRREGPYRHVWLAVSPDERWVLYGEAPATTSELMLVENFR